MPAAKMEHSCQAEAAWHQQWNHKIWPGSKMQVLGSHSSEKAVWQAACKKRGHIHIKAIDTVNDTGREAIFCRACKQTKRCASSHEQRLYSLLTKNHWSFATEVYLAEADATFKHHAFDVLVLVKHGEGAYQLLIEVDGEQHFHAGGKGWANVEEQQERDAALDAAVMQAGLFLLRLHYQDTPLEGFFAVGHHFFCVAFPYVGLSLHRQDFCLGIEPF
jgi:very-short-patch-repair endonuclease